MRKTTVKTITELISSTVPENQYNGVAVPQGKWAGGTHTLGQIVYHDGTFPFIVYECLVASTITTPGMDTTIWKSKGAIDSHRAFDIYHDTYTAGIGHIEFEIDSSNCDSVGLFRLQARSVEISLIVDSTVYDYKFIDMDVANIIDWYEYDTAGFDYKENLVWYFDRYSNSKLKIKVSYTATEEARCGMARVGESMGLGKTLADPTVSVDDYSIVDIDGLGTFLKEGSYSDTGDFEIIFPSFMTDVVKRSLVASRGKEAIYDFNNTNDELFLESFLFLGVPERYAIKPKRRTKTNKDMATATFNMKGTP